MHAEHAELIATLRRENLALTAKLADMSQMQSVIDGQDKLLAVAAITIRNLTDAFERAQKDIEQVNMLLEGMRTP